MRWTPPASLLDVLRRLMVEGRDGLLDLDEMPPLCREVTGVEIGEIYRHWLGPVR